MFPKYNIVQKKKRLQILKIKNYQIRELWCNVIENLMTLYLQSSQERRKMADYPKTILNSKYFNEFVKFSYFKMKSLPNVLKTIKKNVWRPVLTLKMPSS